MWIPIPTTDAFQTVEVKSINAPGTPQMLKDSEYGNTVLFLNLGAEDSGKTIEIRCQVKRLEKGVYDSKPKTRSNTSIPTTWCPADDRFRTIAEEVVEGQNRRPRARPRAVRPCHQTHALRQGRRGLGPGRRRLMPVTPARQLHRFPFLLHRPVPGGRHSRTVCHRRRHPFGAERRRRRRLSLLGGVLHRRQVVARRYQRGRQVFAAVHLLLRPPSGQPRRTEPRPRPRPRTGPGIRSDQFPGLSGPGNRRRTHKSKSRLLLQPKHRRQTLNNRSPKRQRRDCDTLW